MQNLSRGLLFHSRSLISCSTVKKLLIFMKSFKAFNWIFLKPINDFKSLSFILHLNLIGLHRN